MQKKEIFLGLLGLVLLGGVFWLGSRGDGEVESESVTATLESAAYFNERVSSTTIEKVGRPIEGFIPFMFMQSYPGLVASDFINVEALQGIYSIKDGDVVFDFTVPQEEQHTAARAISEIGMKTLLENLGRRLDIDISTKAGVDLVLEKISVSNSTDDVRSEEPETVGSEKPATPPYTPPKTPPKDDSSTGGYVCTMDAKMCPDGSAVGRSGPKCEFSRCPGETAAGFRTCPDEWIVNRMPGPIDNSSPKEYFIIDGKRWEVADFDMDWVKASCDVEPQYVY